MKVSLRAGRESRINLNSVQNIYIYIEFMGVLCLILATNSMGTLFYGALLLNDAVTYVRMRQG